MVLDHLCSSSSWFEDVGVEGQDVKASWQYFGTALARVHQIHTYKNRRGSQIQNGSNLFFCKYKYWPGREIHCLNGSVFLLACRRQQLEPSNPTRWSQWHSSHWACRSDGRNISLHPSLRRWWIIVSKINTKRMSILSFERSLAHSFLAFDFSKWRYN